MANLDIAERRLPQDGRIRAVVHGRKVDLRMSTLPTAYGEKCVMRILDNRSINVALEDLGFGENALTIWKNQIDQPHGILLVTGPTGSGKTTTLYSSLRCMDGNKLNISTVEDPIEYHLGRANQVQVHDKIGMTFSRRPAIAAATGPRRGHARRNSRRRNRAASPCRRRSPATWCSARCTPTTRPASITRLINIGVEPYLISAAVNAILAQRLVRKICPHCKEEFTPSDEMQEFLHAPGLHVRQDLPRQRVRPLPQDRLRRPTGHLRTAGHGRLAARHGHAQSGRHAAPKAVPRARPGHVARRTGSQKVMKGLTTVDEILRVTESGV